MDKSFAPAWRALLAALLLGIGLAVPMAGLAQSSCSSQGQPRPVALLERFINADCVECWSDSRSPTAAAGELALDWVLPGSQGEAAPLSAVANRAALQRLQSLGLAVPAASAQQRTPVTGRVGRLRVAHGVPVSGYVGASITLKPLPRQTAAQPWTAWLALVEALPIGTEGTPVARNLVRNLIQRDWDASRPPDAAAPSTFSESRAMDIPPGMKTERLRLIGWVQDASGRIIAAAQSRCVPP